MGWWKSQPRSALPRRDGTLEPYDQFVVLEKRDGLYAIAWKSSLLDGKIVDLKIGDSDNDDRDELILCLRNRSGSPDSTIRGYKNIWISDFEKPSFFLKTRFLP